MSEDEKRGIAALFLFGTIVILLMLGGDAAASITLEILSYLP